MLDWGLGMEAGAGRVDGGFAGGREGGKGGSA